MAIKAPTKPRRTAEDLETVQVPVRMARWQREELKRISTDEERNLQTVLLRALRTQYPALDES
jgi:hypothetical protein